METTRPQLRGLRVMVIRESALCAAGDSGEPRAASRTLRRNHRASGSLFLSH